MKCWGRGEFGRLGNGLMHRPPAHEAVFRIARDGPPRHSPDPGDLRLAAVGRDDQPDIDPLLGKAAAKGLD